MFLSKTVAILFVFVVTETQRVSVPIKDVWAHDIPNTKSVFDLEPKVMGLGLTNQEFLKRSTVVRISRALARLDQGQSTKHKAGSGFAVAGKDLEALKNVHRVLVDKKKRILEFSEGEAIWVVYYTGISGRYVRLDQVTRDGKDIRIHYHLVTHSTMNATTHFALIPLGALPASAYRVFYVNGPPEAGDSLASSKPLTPDRLSRTICASFEFLVN